MPGSIKIDDGSGNYTILTNAGSLGSDKTITIPNETATIATTTATDLGGLVKLASTTASSSATITFDDVFDASTYSSYIINLEQILAASDNVALRYNFRQGGASGSDITGGYDLWGNYFLNSNSTQNDMKQSSTDYVTLASTMGNVSTAEALSTSLAFTANSGGWKMLSANFEIRRSDNLHIQYDHISGKNTATVCTGIKFYFSSGNIASGTMTVYGMKK